MKGKTPMPSFYNPANAEKWSYRPNMDSLFTEAVRWQEEKHIPVAGTDITRIHLLIIDAQKDFCFPEGTLYVAGRNGRGAIEDNQRLAEFVYRNISLISDITTTLDTHFAFQIFFAPFWRTQDGKPLSAHTLITLDDEDRLINITATGDVLHKNVEPDAGITWWLCNKNITWLKSQVKHYCRELKRAGKYTLYLWPSHCVLGSDGHSLAGIIHEAQMFHSFVRKNQSLMEIKGTHPLTENYSVLSPEVLTRFDAKGMLADRNTDFIKKLLSADMLIIAGQADSHCVKSTIEDLLGDIMVQDPELVKKVYIMTDCMSAVVVRDPKGTILADFTDNAEEAHKKFADAGMHLVRSTDPIYSWPDVKIS